MRSAVISKCGKYRYRLDRVLGGKRRHVLGAIMVNPSTADSNTNDPTINKLIAVASRNQFTDLIVGNKFAWRSKDVADLKKVADPIGPENDEYLKQIITECDVLLFAWGAISKVQAVPLQRRWWRVYRIAEQLNKQPHCLAVLKDGHPVHPLYQPYNAPIVPWEPPVRY